MGDVAFLRFVSVNNAHDMSLGSPNETANRSSLLRRTECTTPETGRARNLPNWLVPRRYWKESKNFADGRLAVFAESTFGLSIKKSVDYLYFLADVAQESHITSKIPCS